MRRVLLLAGAVAAALWLAGNLRSVDRLDAAVTGLSQPGDGPGADARIARAEDLFQSARRFAPDTRVLVSEAGALAGAGSGRAVPLLREAVRREPENLEAWLLLYTLSAARDPGLSARAREEVLALDPGARAQLR